MMIHDKDDPLSIKLPWNYARPNEPRQLVI